jgi:vacuolar protein sorting-associated protein 26
VLPHRIPRYPQAHSEIYANKDLSTEFMSLSKELEPAGLMTENKSYKFKFPNFEKEYETFNGIAGRVRYFVRVIVAKNYKFSVTK